MLGRLWRAGGIALIGGNAVQAIVAFSANLIMVRYVIPEEFGRFAIALASVNLTLAVLSLRLSVMIMRCPDDELDLRRRSVYLSIALFEASAATLVAAVWLVCVGSADAWQFILLLSASCSHWLNVDRAFFERGMKYGRIATCETLSVVSGHLIGVAALFLGAGASALYLREIFAVICLAVSMRWVGALSATPLVVPTKQEWRRVLEEARSVWVDAALEGAFSRLVTLVLAAFGGERAAGLFAQAQRLAMVPHQFLSPIATRMAAAWFGQSGDLLDKSRQRRQLLLSAILILLPSAFVSALSAGLVVPFLFGQGWVSVVPILVMLSGLIVFHTLFETSRTYALSCDQAGPLLLARVAQYGGFAAGFVCLSDPALGAGLGVSVAALASFATIEILLRRRERARACAQ